MICAVIDEEAGLPENYFIPRVCWPFGKLPPFTIAAPTNYPLDPRLLRVSLFCIGRPIDYWNLVGPFLIEAAAYYWRASPLLLIGTNEFDFISPESLFDSMLPCRPAPI